MENKGYFSQGYLYGSILAWTPHLQSQECSLPGTARVPFLLEISTWILAGWGGVRESFLHPLFLNCLQLKIVTMPKWDILGYSDPLQVHWILWNKVSAPNRMWDLWQRVNFRNKINYVPAHICLVTAQFLPVIKVKNNTSKALFVM